MAHPQQHNFCKQVKNIFPQFFTNSKVLEIGSLNINGTIKTLFENCDYLGIDVGPGPNVDLVCEGHKLDKPDQYFDVVCTTEALEHDMHIKQTILNSIRMLRKGGLYFFTCAGYGRPEHGTPRTDAYSSPNTCAIPEWANYYENVTASTLTNILNIEETFSRYVLQYAPLDLYFWGIKR